MADAEILIKVGADVGGAKTIKRSLDDVSNSADRATGQTTRLERQMGSLNRAANLLKGAFAGLIASFGFRELVRLSDTFTTLETQLKNVTNSTAQYNKVFNQLFVIAQKNGDSFQGLNQTYVQLNSSLPDAVRNTTDLVKVTELLSRGFAASGSSAQAASNTMIQITQGLAGNFANAAQEINSLIEGAPLLAKIISEQLGGQAATDLKKFAEEGKLTRDSFLQALLAAESAIKAYEIPATISRSITRLGNSLLRIVGESKGVQGAAGALAGAIDFLSGNLDNLIKVIGILIGASLPLLIKSFALSLPAAIGATTTAIGALNVMIAANPLGAIAVGVSAAISAFFLFRKEIFEVLDDVKIFGIDVTDVFFTIKNTAIEIFKSLADILTLPFKLAYNAINNTVRSIQIMYNKIPGVKDIPVNEFRSQTGAIGDTFTRVGNIENRIVENTARDIINFDNRSLGSAPVLPEFTDPNSGNNVSNNIDKATKSAKKLTKEIKDPMTDAVKDLADTIERDFAQAFKDAFSGTEGGFKRLVEGMKASFTNFLGEIAYQAAARPILMSLGVVGGVAGGSSSASAGGLSAILGGGGGSFGGLSSLFSAGKNLLSGGSSQILTGGLNKIGSILGIGGVGPNGPVSLSSYSSLTNGSFGGSLGGAAGGFIGNFGANALFGGDRGVGANIGGTIGGIAGSFIPVPILGPAIGSFIGNAIGGLFGGGSIPSNAAQISFGASGGLLKTGKISSDEASEERLKQIKTAGGSVTQTINNLMGAIGGSLERSPNFILGATRREPGIAKISGMRGSGQSGEFVFGSFQKAVDFALTNVLARSDISGVSEGFENIFKNIFAKGGKFETRAAEVLEAKALYDLIEGVDKEAISPLKIALDELDAEFDRLRGTASGLGLDVDKLNQVFEEQRTAIIQESLAPLQQFLDAQALSGQSSLSSVERLSLARSAFDENLNAINSGDLSGLGNITNQASTLLGLGRDVFASGEGFNALESFVRQSITGIAGTLGAEGGLDDSIAREMSLNSAQQTSLLEQMNVELQELREENRKLRKSMERVGNAVVSMTS